MKTTSFICMLTMIYVSSGLTKEAMAQSNYKTAIGVRAGGTSGLTVKHFTSSSTALEGIVGIWPYGFSLTGLYEKHANAGVSGLNWYYGGGAHIAAHNGYYHYRPHPVYYERRYYRSGDVGLGVDGIVGLEYKIPPIPIAISLDLKPFIEVTTRGNAFFSLDPGLGIKVAF